MCGVVHWENPTPDGGVFAGQHELSADSGSPPRPTPLLSESIPPPSPPATPSLTPGHQ